MAEYGCLTPPLQILLLEYMARTLTQKAQVIPQYRYLLTSCRKLLQSPPKYLIYPLELLSKSLNTVSYNRQLWIAWPAMLHVFLPYLACRRRYQLNPI